MNTNPNLATVSVIMPVYNEERYIEKCLDSILRQDYGNVCEILLADGMSTDKTRELIQAYIEKYPIIKLFDNPNREVQYALNIAIRNATGEYIVRFDAHAEYADDYISQSIKCLQETGAFDVGGPMIAKGKTPLTETIAAAFHSAFALGGGKDHDETYTGYADTVFLGAYRRQEILDLGLYDERFSRTEDDELCLRAAKNGKKIYITTDIKSTYYPKESIRRLSKQYFDYGLMKPCILKKHKRPARISHLVPAMFVLYLLFGALLSILFPPVAWLYGGVFVLYVLLDAYFSFTNSHIHKFSQKLLLMVIHFVIHVSYGTGFIIGFFRFYLCNALKF